MWNQTRTDRAGNETVGPVVTFNAIDQICNHFKDVEAMNNAKTTRISKFNFTYLFF